MRFDTVIIGGGLAGMACGIRLAEAGQRCAIVSQGQSAIHFSSGSFDLLGRLPDGTPVTDPVAGIAALAESAPAHPYSVIGAERCARHAETAAELLRSAGIRVAGDSRRNHFRITPMGKVKATWLTIDGYLTTDEADRLPFKTVCIVNVEGFLDFYPEFIAEEFRKNGARVCVIDKQPGAGFTGDVADASTLRRFAEAVIAECGHVDFLINNALPPMRGIDECTWEEFNYALRVGVSAPFYLTKLFLPHFAPGAAIVNISSSRDRMSQPQTESYTAAKGGIAALTHALAVSLAGKVRVNSISPGWIDTSFRRYTGPDALQQPAGRVGDPLDIANMALYLCSDKAGFITGENICIDGGMTRQMIYHGDWGWSLEDAPRG